MKENIKIFLRDEDIVKEEETSIKKRKYLQRIKILKNQMKLDLLRMQKNLKKMKILKLK